MALHRRQTDFENDCNALYLTGSEHDEKDDIKIRPYWIPGNSAAPRGARLPVKFAKASSRFSRRPQDFVVSFRYLEGLCARNWKNGSGNGLPHRKTNTLRTSMAVFQPKTKPASLLLTLATPSLSYRKERSGKHWEHCRMRREEAEGQTKYRSEVCEHRGDANASLATVFEMPMRLMK